MAPDGLLKTCACKKDWHVGERGEVCFSALDLVCVLRNGEWGRYGEDGNIWWGKK